MKRRMIAVELAFALVISVIAAKGANPLFVSLSGDQNLELVFVEWKPSSDPLSIKGLPVSGESPETKLTAEEFYRLKDIGLNGRLEIVGRSEHGHGKRSRAVIVMSHQITNTVELWQPDGVDVIYVQERNEWKMYPSDAPTLKRIIRLEVLKISPRNTQCMVELSYGAMQGGLAFSW